MLSYRKWDEFRLDLHNSSDEMHVAIDAPTCRFSVSRGMSVLGMQSFVLTLFDAASLPSFATTFLSSISQRRLELHKMIFSKSQDHAKGG